MERLDKFHKWILEYIEKSPESTENQIVKAMHEQKKCSRMTTLRKLDELIEKQEIKDLLKKGESGFHRFVINQNNEFKRISEKLSELKPLIDRFEEFEKLIKKRRKQKQYPLDSATNERYLFEEHNFFNSINFLIISLLDIIISEIKSENDAQILYRKSTELQIKLFKTTGHSWWELRNILLKIYESREEELRLRFDKWFNKLKSAPKSDRNKSEMKNVFESLATERDIDSALSQLYKSMRKTHDEFLRFFEKQKERYE